ncbi:hypothetical protein MTO96_044751 [Rhipicephalus appendiculatus]
MGCVQRCRRPPVPSSSSSSELRAAVSEAAGTVDTAFLLEGVTSDCAVVAPFLRYGCGIRWRALRRDVHVSPRRIGHTFAAITNGLPCPSRPPGQLARQDGQSSASPPHGHGVAGPLRGPARFQLPRNGSPSHHIEEVKAMELMDGVVITRLSGDAISLPSAVMASDEEREGPSNVRIPGLSNHCGSSEVRCYAGIDVACAPVSVLAFCTLYNAAALVGQFQSRH